MMYDLIDYILGVLYILIAIFIALSIHEWGHYIVARLFKIHTKEFAVGYGATIWRKRFRHTDFLIKKYPFVAHVSLDNKGFESISFIKKALIVAAGPAINVCLAFLLFFCFFFMIGQPSTPPVLSGVEIGHSADIAGLKPDDKILKLNGKEVSRYEEVRDLTYPLPLKKIELQVLRENKTISLNAKTEKASYVDNRGVKKEHGRLGVLVRHKPYKISAIKEINGVNFEGLQDHIIKKIISEHYDQDVVIKLKSTDNTNRAYKTFLSQELNQNNIYRNMSEKFILGRIGNNFYLDLGFYTAARESIKQTQTLVTAIAEIPLHLFPLDRDRFSPKSLVYEDGLNIKGNLYKFFFLTALISIFVALLNLIPFPFFDGGRLLRLTIEALIARKMTIKEITIITIITISTFYALMAVSNFEKFSTYASHLMG